MKLKIEHQIMYIRSMGKALQITGIFTDLNECNKHCENSNDGVIAEFGKYIFTANL